MKGNAERGGSTPKHYGNRCSIPVWTPVNPTNPQNLGIHGATPKRGCAEMEASTIKQSKHRGNRCSIPPANQTKPKNTGIDGATLKNGLQVTSKHGRLKRRDPQEIYQNTVENMQSQPNPKKAGIDGATPKGASSHLNTLPQSPKKGCKSNNKLLKVQDLQKTWLCLAELKNSFLEFFCVIFIVFFFLSLVAFKLIFISRLLS